MLRFEEELEGWRSSRLSQSEAALLLGVCEWTFRRQIARYESEGFDGLIDKRLSQVSHRRAPVDEVVRIVELYRRDYKGWNVKHFHNWYHSASMAASAAIRGSRRRCRSVAWWPGPRAGASIASDANVRHYRVCWCTRMRARISGCLTSTGIWW